MFEISVLAFIIIITYLIFKLNTKRFSGQLVIKTNEEGKKIFLLELDKSPSDLENLHSVTFKVVKEESRGYDCP